MAKRAGGFSMIARAMMALLAAALIAPAPAQAQFSKSYKFLEAVRKKDGAVVEDAIGEPGSQIVNTRDSTNGETALHIVTARRDLTWMNFLIAKGANVNVHDGRGVTPLQLAVTLGFPEGVDLLVSQRARVDEPNSEGETPLISAVHRRDTALMRILLKAGANPDRSDNSGRSARDYALLNGPSNPLISEINNNAKPAGQRSGPQRSYGPTL
ncbi:MAG: ankyrin repeat domain-containing protein [Novosphingobium sp.]